MSKSMIEVFRQAMGKGLLELDLLDLAQLPKTTHKLNQTEISKYNKTVESFLAGNLTEETFTHRARVITGMNKRDVEKILSNLRTNQIYPLIKT